MPLLPGAKGRLISLNHQKNPRGVIQKKPKSWKWLGSRLIGFPKIHSMRFPQTHLPLCILTLGNSCLTNSSIKALRKNGRCTYRTNPLTKKSCTIKAIWNQFQQGGFSGIADLHTDEADGSFYLALLAYNGNKIESALEFTQKACDFAPENILFAQARTSLKSVLSQGKQRVYVTPDGFSAFIRGGGNLGLYKSLSAALKQAYQAYPTLTLLDIGAGDGFALLPAMTENIRHIDVLEPSKPMMQNLHSELLRRCISHENFETTLQEFTKIPPKRHWDVMQATFSLQSIPPEEREGVFQWLAKNGSRLLIAEFDAPEFSDQCSPERAQYVAKHYERGLAEYLDDRDLVAQGFLMPVMFGYFDSTGARTNFEHPIQEWVGQLRAAGYTTIECGKLFPYWWAPAFLIDARP